MIEETYSCTQGNKRKEDVENKESPLGFVRKGTCIVRVFFVRGVIIYIGNAAILLKHKFVGMECKIPDGKEDAGI